MNKIREYQPNEIQYAKLKLFADFTNNILTEIGDALHKVCVENIYFDFGQNWKYTALVTYKGGSDSWQSFYAREYELIIDTDSIDEMYAMAKFYAKSLANGKICVDLKLYKVEDET